MIEDDPLARATLIDLLSEEGYRCVQAADGQEAMTWLGAEAEPPCAILLDLMMPGMNGWQFCAWQRSHPAYERVPVIVLSAVRDGASEAARLGADAFLPKPIDLEALLELVERYCGRA